MNIHKHQTIFASLIFTVILQGLPKPLMAQNLPTYFVAPFSASSSSGSEYLWIGDAMAQALTTRLHKSAQVNYLSMRQVAAAIRNDNIERAMLHDPQTASRLGKLLGADYGIVCSYNAAWPDISFIVRIVDIKKRQVQTTLSRSGHLDQLVTIESELASAIAGALKLNRLPVKKGEFGTADLYAWRQLILGQRILWEQSLSPAGQIILPPEAAATALKHFEKASLLDAKFAQAWADQAIAMSVAQRHQDALTAVAKALALSKADEPEVVLAAYFVHWRLASDTAAASSLKKKP